MSTNDGGSDPYDTGHLPGITNIANPAPADGCVLQYVDNQANWVIGSDTIQNQKIVMTGKELEIQDPETNETVEVLGAIKAMQERLLILEPNFEQMEEYPALKDAYNQYKMLEKLLIENNQNES